MEAALERLVWRRAKSRCEYCQLAQAFSPLPHAIDHIVARQHHGPTEADNLALARLLLLQQLQRAEHFRAEPADRTDGAIIQPAQGSLEPPFCMEWPLPGWAHAYGARDGSTA
jgi:hypothetical protein